MKPTDKEAVNLPAMKGPNCYALTRGNSMLVNPVGVGVNLSILSAG
jgi:hypothetical protein